MAHMPHPVPRLEIVEQPKQRGMRFRYECEGRSAGSIPGENTTGDKKTWPSCQIIGYSGPAIMRVSLVSKDDPPRPHPHGLVGRDCDRGVCQINLDPGNQMLGVFPNLGIQCVRRKEVSQSIRDRIMNNINPFGTLMDGDERSAVDVDLNIVRLCFEAFLPDHRGNYTRKLTPVVSNPIYDKKATSSSVLKICRVDKTHGSAKGREEVFLLCDKVQKEDIQVVFYREQWEALAEFSSIDVHRQVAIVFRTPPYKDENIHDRVDVEFMLRRPSDGEVSRSLHFTYVPHQHETKHKFFATSFTNRTPLGRRDEVKQGIYEKVRTSQMSRAATADKANSSASIFSTQPGFTPQFQAIAHPPPRSIKREPILQQSPYDIQPFPTISNPVPEDFLPNIPSMLGDFPHVPSAAMPEITDSLTEMLGVAPPVAEDNFPSVGAEAVQRFLGDLQHADKTETTDLDLLMEQKLSIDKEPPNMSITENHIPLSPVNNFLPRTDPQNVYPQSSPQLPPSYAGNTFQHYPPQHPAPQFRASAAEPFSPDHQMFPQQNHVSPHMPPPQQFYQFNNNNSNMMFNFNRPPAAPDNPPNQTEMIDTFLENIEASSNTRSPFYAPADKN